MNLPPIPSRARPDLLPEQFPLELGLALKRRLLALAEMLPAEDRVAFRTRIPAHLALPSTASVLAPLPAEVGAAKVALRGVFEKFPLAASLAEMLDGKSPHRHPHDRLLAWVIYASFSLLEKSQQYQDAISRALADSRLLAGRAEERGLLLCFTSDVTNTSAVVEALTQMKSDRAASRISNRHVDAVRVVIEYFQNDVSPITRVHGPAYQKHYLSRSMLAQRAETVDEDQPVVEEIVTVVSQTDIREWRDDDSGEASTLVRSKPIGSHRERKIFAIQRSRARGYVNSLALRGHRLPSHWDQATSHEIREVIRISRARMEPGSCENWRDYLGVILIIALGRPPDALIKILSPDIESESLGHLDGGYRGRWTYEFKPGVPRRKRIGDPERKVLRTEGAETVQIFLPEFLTRALCALCLQVGGPAAMPNPGAITSELSKGLSRPVSLLRLSKVLRDRLESEIDDSSLAGLVVGRSAKNLASLYYTAHRLETLQNAYDSVIGKLFGIDQERQLTSQAEIGTRNRYRRGAVRALYKSSKDKIETSRNAHWPTQVRFHNFYALYTYLLLSLATGHRPVRNPFESIRDFDLKRGFVYLGDKANKVGPNFRILPLAPTAARQVEAWRRHLTFIGDQWTFTQPKVSEAAQRAVRGEGDPSIFLFFIDADMEAGNEVDRFQAVPFTPTDVLARLQEIWPVKENWGRHEMRTRLARKLPDELLDAFMGHNAIEAEPFIRESGLAMADFAGLRDAIESVLREMWVDAVNGLG